MSAVAAGFGDGAPTPTPRHVGCAESRGFEGAQTPLARSQCVQHCVGWLMTSKGS